MDTSQGKGEFKSMEKRVLGGRPHKDRVLNCPRCNSSNTKFCYYNNYSLSQPRYICKSCRRYWTEGGTLRNVPASGGSRKNKRPSFSSSCTSSSSANNYPCLSKTVSVSINVDPIGPPDSLSSRNPSFGFLDLALAGNYLLPGVVFQDPPEKSFEPVHNRAFPNTVLEVGVSPIGLALGSSPMSITPHFMTSMASAADHPMGQLMFPFEFPLEGGIGSMHRAAGIDKKELVEVLGGCGDKLQMQGDQSHQGFWGGFFGAAGPCPFPVLGTGNQVEECDLGFRKECI